MITHQQTAVELYLTERHIRRVLIGLMKVGDKAALHGLRGRVSNRKLSGEEEESDLLDQLSRPLTIVIGLSLLCTTHNLLI